MWRCYLRTEPYPCEWGKGHVPKALLPGRRLRGQHHGLSVECDPRYHSRRTSSGNALQARHAVTPRVITVDKNAAFPPAFATLQREGQLPASCTHLCHPSAANSALASWRSTVSNPS